jgi:hypothetical protein
MPARAAKRTPDEVEQTPMTSEVMDAGSVGRGRSKHHGNAVVSKSALSDALDAKLKNGAFAILVVAVAAAVGTGSWNPPEYVIIVAALVSTAILVLGVNVVAQMLGDAFRASSLTRKIVPLTDASIDLTTANKFANSCQVREKGLKILQYVCRGAAYSGLLPKNLSKELKALSKTTSVARRFFKFCRWCKHFEDLQEARDEPSLMLRALLYLRVAANFGADWAEDVCSLERVGLLAKGTLSVEFMLFAEYCQLVLALVEIYVTTARVGDEARKTIKVEQDEAKSDKDVLKQQRKLHLMRLELSKFVSDVGKAIFDCEFSFAHEGVFICCSLFSAMVSTHKNMVKVVK